MDLLKHLAAALLLLVPACYEPQWQDCAVRCSSSEDCAPGQACGAQGYCASPDRACTPAIADARPPDSRKPDDKPKGQLRVQTSAGGRISIGGAGTCDTAPPHNGDCLLSVTLGEQQEVRAIPDSGYLFKRWTSPTCGVAGEICFFVPLGPLTEVRALFQHDTDDDAHAR